MITRRERQCSPYLQEQTQIIATAIGRPAAKAPTIIKENATRGFASGRTLSTDMSLHHSDKSKSRHRNECGDAHTRVQ